MAVLRLGYHVFSVEVADAVYRSLRDELGSMVDDATTGVFELLGLAALFYRPGSDPAEAMRRAAEIMESATPGVIDVILSRRENAELLRRLGIGEIIVERG